MKKLFTLSIMICLAGMIMAQESYDNRVFEEKEMTFYGYDYSHFKLADAKKFGKSKEDKDNMISIWTDWLNKYISQELLQKRMYKTKVTMNGAVTEALNKNVKLADNLVEERYFLEKENIPTWIKNYNLPETEGMGFVAIMECYYRGKDKASMHFVFFDIATRDILASIPFETKEADGGGLEEYWGKAAEFNFKKYIADHYKKAYKNYQKSLEQ